jgi:hypothetical protein
MNIYLMEHQEKSICIFEPISLQLMNPNYKPIHACAYTAPRSVEQQLQQTKEIVRLVNIGVLEEHYSSEWDSMIPII